MFKDGISDFFSGASDWLAEANKYAQFGNILFGDGSIQPGTYNPGAPYPAYNPGNYPAYNPGSVYNSNNDNTMNYVIIGAVGLIAVLLLTSKKR